MHVPSLIQRIQDLETAIRQHRDERGDDRCHADDGRLYAILPEGDTRPERETLVTIENCQKYIECRQTGREYISPQRRIEELEAEIDRLKYGVGNYKCGCRVVTRTDSIHNFCPTHHKVIAGKSYNPPGE